MRPYGSPPRWAGGAGASREPVPAGSAFLAVITLAIGLLAGPAVGLAERGAHQLIDGRDYRNAAMDRADAPEAANASKSADTPAPPGPSAREDAP